MKTCTKCNEAKAESEFNLNRSGKSLRARCIACNKADALLVSSTYYAKHREAVLLQGKEKRDTPEYKAYRKAYRDTPEYKAYRKAYRDTPDQKAKQQEYAAKRWADATPDKKEAAKVAGKKYYTTRDAATVQRLREYQAKAASERRATSRDRIKEALAQEAQTRRNIEALENEHE